MFCFRAIRHRKFQSQIVHRPPKLAQEFVAAFEITFKSIQALVIPTRQDFLRTVREIGNVDLDVLGLANSIQSSDALFQQLRIQRKVEQDKMMRELKIPVTPQSVMERYDGLIDGYVVDGRDADAVAVPGLSVRAARILMQTLDDRRQLAETVLSFADDLASA